MGPVTARTHPSTHHPTPRGEPHPLRALRGLTPCHPFSLPDSTPTALASVAELGFAVPEVKVEVLSLLDHPAQGKTRRNDGLGIIGQTGCLLPVLEQIDDCIRQGPGVLRWDEKPGLSMLDNLGDSIHRCGDDRLAERSRLDKDKGQAFPERGEDEYIKQGEKLGRILPLAEEKEFLFQALAANFFSQPPADWSFPDHDNTGAGRGRKEARRCFEQSGNSFLPVEARHSAD
jgi:hypothetical protein